MQDLIKLRRNGPFVGDEIRLKHTNGTGRKYESALCGGLQDKGQGPTGLVKICMMLDLRSRDSDRYVF
jgi:hypothetical protein